MFIRFVTSVVAIVAWVGYALTGSYLLLVAALALSVVCLILLLRTPTR